jgi:hypothetical protein
VTQFSMTVRCEAPATPTPQPVPPPDINTRDGQRF